MSANVYPIVANCNYQSAEDRTIHEIRKAVEAGLTNDPALIEAMDALEETLSEHAESDLAPSREACADAERAVLAAWTDEVQQAIETERVSRYRD